MPPIPPQANSKAALPEEANFKELKLPVRPRRRVKITLSDVSGAVYKLKIQIFDPPGPPVIVDKSIPKNLMDKPRNAGMVDVKKAIQEVLIEYHCDKHPKVLEGFEYAF